MPNFHIASPVMVAGEIKKQGLIELSAEAAEPYVLSGSLIPVITQDEAADLAAFAKQKADEEAAALLKQQADEEAAALAQKKAQEDAAALEAQKKKDAAGATEGAAKG